jgi:TonB family protein
MAVASYQLKSELARVCLPAPTRVVSRRLALANSISLLFLIIGVLGAQSRLPSRRMVPPLEQPAPIIIEPQPLTPPAAEAKPTEQQNEDEKPETPHFQAVTLDTPAINFAVPTPGSLLVPMSVAPTPVEAAPLKRAAPVRHDPTTVQSSGAGGERADPDYPKWYQDMGLQGTVGLSFNVDDSGRVISAEINESSGSAILDQHTLDFIKRRWMVPPINGGHVFKVSIKYLLRRN